MESNGGSDRLSMYTNTRRSQVSLNCRVAKPLLVRETLAALYDVVSGDFSYKPKDRSAYLAYQAMKKQAASANAWEARQAYFDWLERNDPNAWLVLDPIVSVFPDRVQFEVFSKDEGAYAIAAIDLDAFELDSKPVCGTTNIDFSKDFVAGVERIRSYRETRLQIGAEAVSVETSGVKAVEKKIKLPYSWLRGLLQVQSAAVLPRTPIQLAPLDL